MTLLGSEVSVYTEATWESVCKEMVLLAGAEPTWREANEYTPFTLTMGYLLIVKHKNTQETRLEQFLIQQFYKAI